MALPFVIELEVVMTLEQLNKLEDGALLECKGTNFMGERVKKLIYFEKKCLLVSKSQYRVGSWIYPISWLSIPTLATINARVREIEIETKRHIEKLKSGYDKTKKALTKKE